MLLLVVYNIPPLPSINMHFKIRARLSTVCVRCWKRVSANRRLQDKASLSRGGTGAWRLSSCRFWKRGAAAFAAWRQGTGGKCRIGIIEVQYHVIVIVISGSFASPGGKATFSCSPLLLKSTVVTSRTYRYHVAYYSIKRSMCAYMFTLAPSVWVWHMIVRVLDVECWESYQLSIACV